MCAYDIILQMCCQDQEYVAIIHMGSYVLAC